MDPQPSRLAEALDRWEERSSRRVTAPQDALAVLETIERTLEADVRASIEPRLWRRYLNTTGDSVYLRTLPDRVARVRWAETAFKTIQLSDYSLRDVFEHRVSKNPQRILFQDMSGTLPVLWTYEQIGLHLSEIVAVFLSTVPQDPRVAIFCDNCVEGACCDLACLFYDVFDTPLNPAFDQTVLVDIFDRLRINIAVTDSIERRKRLETVRRAVREPFRIFTVDPNVSDEGQGVAFLGERCKQLRRDDIDRTLAKRKRRPLNQVATTMFTSGSTGEPKGVSFSLYNLVSKRFARAAALPDVGDGEKLLCYLPLYHTFGRYLELQGSIYWGGTYVLPGTPSSERLFSLFPKVNPTGFISVPLRWGQLYENALERMRPFRDEKGRAEAFRSVVGKRLRWGLSAAGYLSPSVFHFFQANGVELCSGFGLTEATGGVTMTPPGDYVNDTTGIPLPGVTSRFTDKGELELAGHYVAWYLEKKGPDDVIPYPAPDREDHWISTGDVFLVRPDGYYEIVDRTKDVFKNSKGQTVAPRNMEKRLSGVPGIKRACLVGDGRAHNVLLIVPDWDDPVLKTTAPSEDPHEYFRQLVAAANQALAPYERAVSFALLERDFDPAKGELTAKGTFKRKVIEEHFADRIEELYGKDSIELTHDGFRLRIPLWFYRDLGILEDDIRPTREGLINRRTGRILTIAKNVAFSSVLIGDLEYRLGGDVIDLGIFARQPRLWLGNPSLVSFCPCKDGWDVRARDVSPQIFRPLETPRTYTLEELPELTQVRDPILIVMNKLLSGALHGDKQTALRSIEYLGQELREADDRTEEVIWRRLEALSHHPDEDVRCLAYKTLLFEEPAPDFSRAFPTFVLSGLSFLNQESMRSIAFERVEPRRLDALRQRLFAYRTQLEWPVPAHTRLQIENVLRLLSGFVDNQPEFYDSARAELASWALHKRDPILARAARGILEDLMDRFDRKVEAETRHVSPADWNSRLVYGDEITRHEVRRIEKVLLGTTFLKQSITVAYNERAFELADVSACGVWISRIDSSNRYLRYRMSVNTKSGKHYNLRLALPKTRGKAIDETMVWHASIAGHPFGAPVLPRLGCWQPALRAHSSRYIGDLTVWERIRHSCGTVGDGRRPSTGGAWRKLFIQGMEAFFRGWHRSEGQIVPGLVSPENVAVSEMDFGESARILSLAGWSRYKNTLSLIGPMLRNFYAKTLAFYPPCKGQLDVRWVLDACLEALGEESAARFVERLLIDLEREPLACPEGGKVRDVLSSYYEDTKATYYAPLALRNAIEKYGEWESANPSASAAAREQTLARLYDTYRLFRLPEIARYYFYQRTYFSNADLRVTSAFDDLLSQLRESSRVPPVQLPALLELQAALTHGEDREVFSRMLFPRLPSNGKVDLLRIGERGEERIVVHSSVTDRRGETYTCRDATEPSEIGELYRLFFIEHHPITFSIQDRHCVVVDRHEQVVGGICYRLPGPEVAEIQGLVVASPLEDRGVEGAIVEDFCARMAGGGVKMVKAPVVSDKSFLEFGFTADRRWSGLARSLALDRG